MSGPVPEHQQRSSQDDKRRKRKNRAAKNRTPEPKEIVSGAGQPLDHSTRRELEERLGHDFSRVRVHTDRDAGQLTDALGADAVAVGQDVLFGPGKFRPGTAEGNDLLAHELLHTVQNPTGLGALRAGRDLGGVSLPQQAIEQEAESGSHDETAEVQPGRSSPGWLRYATVDADRTRAESLDPATLVDRVANGIIRSLRGDPEDRSKRTRRQLEHMSDEMREAVLDRLDSRLLSSERERVLDLVEEVETEGLPDNGALSAPAVEPDAESDLQRERETRDQESAERQQRQQQPEEATGPAKEQTAGPGSEGSTPESVQPSEQAGSNEPAADEEAAESVAQGGEPQAEERSDSEQSGESASEDKSAEQSGGEPDQEQPGSGGQTEGGSGEKVSGQDAGSKGSGKADSENEDGAEGDKKQQGEQEQEREPGEQESESENRRGAADPPVGGEKQDEDEQATGSSPGKTREEGPRAGPVSELDGVRNQDAEGPQEQPVSPPAGGDSEVEVGGGEQSAWDIKLKPEDFLPDKDLDVSGVPTADELEPGSNSEPAMPSFPAPPPTKADQVHAEREAEDAEDAAEQQEAEQRDDSEPPLESTPSVETETTPQPSDLDDLATDRAAEPGPRSEKPQDPKSAEDPEKGPVEAQRAAQDSSGKAEGAKDEAGGAVKESAAKQEKQQPGGESAEGGEKKSGKADAQGSGSGKGSGGEQASETAAKTSTEDSEKATGDGDKQQTGAADAESTSETQASPPTGGKTEQSGDRSGESNATQPGQNSGGEQESTSGGQESTKPQESSKPQSAPQSGSTEEPARTAEASPKAPAPKPEAAKPTKADVPEKAAEPKKPEGAAKQDERPKAEPAKSGLAPQAPTGGGKGAAGDAGAKPAPKGETGKKQQAAPNLSNMSPEAGLRTASRLKPHQALQAMSGVDSAVDRSVGDEHQKLSADPPSTQRPAGAPQTLEGKPKTDAPAEYSNQAAKKADAPEKKNAEVKDQNKPEGKIPAEEVEEPSGWDTFMMGLGYVVGEIGSWFDSDIKPEDLAATFADMPTEDEQLKKAKAGTAPDVEMQGKADQKSRDQDRNVQNKGDEAQRTARDDSRRRMGEDQVYPNVPEEKQSGKVPGRQQDKGGAPASPGTGAVPADAASEVAEHERGKQYRSSFGKGEQGLADAKQKKDKDTRTSKAEHQGSVDREVRKNTQQQGSQRQRTVGEVSGERQRWRSEQDAELNKLGTKKSDKRNKAEKDVDKHEKDTDDKADKRKKDDGDKIRKKGNDAESEAKSKRDDTENQAGNWVEKAFEWIKQKFIELRDKIVGVLREARRAIIDFVDNFKLDIEEMINNIRETIVNLVKKLIDELVELAKAMVRAIVELAEKIRRFITELIERAIALVQKLADQLKQIVDDLLNKIAKLLSDILNALKKALDAAIKAVKDAVKAVLDFASKLLSGLGQFMMVAVDFLRDPGGWLAGAKGSAEEGAKHHFFREVKSAVKTWFQQKIEEIIGLPKAVINKLIEGGLTLGWIVQQVWNAVVPQLPFILGEIIITKVVAKLIPGAGWVMAVIDAIKTAIGALGEILRAFGAVLTWLKSVRKGGAGVLFAKAVAAGVVALLELAYEFLLSGIGKYVGKVGDRLKGIAKNIGKKGRRKNKDGQGDDGEDAGGSSRPRGRADRPGPANTRPGEGRRGRRTGERGREDERRGDERRNEEGRREEGRNEEDLQREDDRVSPSSSARKEAEEPGGTRGQNSEGAKPARGDDRLTDRDRNNRGRAENDQDRRSRQDDDRDTSARRDRDESPAAKDKGSKPKGRNDYKQNTKPTPRARRKPTPDDDRNRRDEITVDPKHKDRYHTTKREENLTPNTNNRSPLKHQKKNDASRNEHPGPTRNHHRERSTQDARQTPGERSQESKNVTEIRKKKEERAKEESSTRSKESRLQKIIRRIQPQLTRTLDKGTRRSALNATLSGLRAWHRLSRLDTSRGQRFEIEAAINPEDVVIAGVHIDSDEILRTVREIAEEVQSSPEMFARSRRVKRTPEGNIDVGRSPQSTAIAAHLRARPLAEGQYARVAAGNESKTSVKQSADSPRNAFVEQPGVPRGQQFHSDYETMFSHSEREQPVDQPLLAKSMINDLAGVTGRPASPLHERTFLHTLGAIEENRSRSDLVYRALAYDLGTRTKTQPGGQKGQPELNTLGAALKNLPLSLPSNYIQNGRTRRRKEGAQSIARQIDFRLLFQERLQALEDPSKLAHDMAERSMREGMTDREIKKLTGTRNTLRTFLKKSGIPPEEYKRISRQKQAKGTDGKPDTEARKEAREQMRAWKEKYAKQAWSDAAAAGTVHETEGAKKMSGRETDYLEEWAKSLELDFSKAADPQRALTDKIRSEVYRIYGLSAR